jgi:hypothetical protein
MKNVRKIQMYKPLLAASLIMGGALQLAAPVLAEGTAGGTTISNTATATYDDPDGNEINSTSNKVEIKVAEVAGIDVSPNNTPTSAAPGGTINYDFVITNTGNDPTKFVLPATATLTGTGTGTVTSVIVSTNSTFGDGDDQTITGPLTTSSIAADGKVYVRVVVTVDANASAGETIIVEYGKSANPAGTNQDYTANGNFDAKTEDNANGATDEVDGTPVNGVREDSATATGTVSAVEGVLNGPNGQPAATGTDNTTRTDFTNKTTTVPADTLPGETIDPAFITYTNTIQNTGNGSNDYTIVPTTATDILEAGGNLPDETKVTIINPATNASAEYTWDKDTGTFTIKSGDTPIVITVAKGATANYQVKIDLPANTELSTDLGTPGDLNSAVGGFPVPIAAYIEDGTTPGFQENEDTNNLTTDRLYTGYMAMYKEARILEDNAATPTVAQDWTTDTALLSAAARPGYYIEYRVSYKNISVAAPSGSNSVDLTAKTFKITEDGLNGNNWAKDNDTNSKIDTSSVLGSASGAGSIDYYNNSPAALGTDKDGDGTAANEVTKYVNAVGDVAPGAATGTFQFKRKIN